MQSVMNGFSDLQFQQILSIMNNNGTEQSSQPQANAAVNSPGLLQAPYSLPQLILDSGATDHITSSPNLLVNSRQNSILPPVTMPSGEQAPITSTGTLPLNSVISLKNVLGVPSFKVNLMSISQVTRGLNCSVTFFPYWCILQDLATKTTIGLGKQRGRLYYLVALASPTPTPKFQSSAAIATKSFCSHVISSTELWHRRLGHLSSSRLNFMANNLLNFPFKLHDACDICALSKQCRLPFSASSISSIRPFELIHCDIWGPYKIPSLSGAKYFLTIMDDYSRFTWVFFMHHKHETQNLLTNFFSFVKTQFNASIANIRVDNGGEFFSMRKFFCQHGTTYQHSCVYTPQQNGVVERKHRHILESARALRFQAHLPLHFWAECVLTAVHLINRLPTPLLSHQTPFEKLYGKIPTYSHLKIFGCLAYATEVHAAHKFAPRATRCVFLGYPVGQKAYKLYNLSTHKYFTSRDVVFHEHIFPYKSSPPIPAHHASTPDSAAPSPVLPLSIPDAPTANYPVSNPASPTPVPLNFSPSVPSNITQSSPPLIPVQPLRRSQRHHSPPPALRDYICNQVTSPTPSLASSSGSSKGTRYPLCNFLSYHRYSPQLCSYTATISQDIEPSSYTEAASFPQWQAAMQSELAAL
jgi:hypothetical protein